MSSCNHYIKAYEGILSTLHTHGALMSGYEEDIDFPAGEIVSETRRDLFELFAEAIRVLGEKDSKKFKLQCEELEERFL